MSQTAQRARMLEAAAQDLRQKAWDSVDTKWGSREGSVPAPKGWANMPGGWLVQYRVPTPADVTDETQFPHIAEARRYYAGLSADVRAQIEREWEA